MSTHRRRPSSLLLGRLLPGLLAFAPGCVGGTAYWRDHEHFERPHVETSGYGPVLGGEAATPMRAEDLVATWGTPDRKAALDGGAERWDYHSSGLLWSGVIPMLVIIPVPLVLPTGRESASFTVRDGVVTAADIVTGDEATALAGFIVGGPCFAVSSTRVEGATHPGHEPRTLMLDRYYERQRAQP
jgi:hypothetical protein